jgi:hypothetical protein
VEAYFDSIEAHFDAIDAKLRLLTWMVGTNVILNIIILSKLLTVCR